VFFLFLLSNGEFINILFHPSEIFCHQDIWSLVSISLVCTPYYPNESFPLASHGLALAQFREDREELCDNSRGRSSLDSLNDKASPQQFVQFEYLPSTSVLCSRSSTVQASSGLQRLLQLPQSRLLAGNNPVSAQQRRASQSTTRLPRPGKKVQKKVEKHLYFGIPSSRTNSPRTHIHKVGEKPKKKFRGARRAPKTYFWG
jgi:hypothetical protein